MEFILKNNMIRPLFFLSLKIRSRKSVRSLIQRSAICVTGMSLKCNHTKISALEWHVWGTKGPFEKVPKVTLWFRCFSHTLGPFPRWNVYRFSAEMFTFRRDPRSSHKGSITNSQIHTVNENIFNFTYAFFSALAEVYQIQSWSVKKWNSLNSLNGF